MKLVDLVNRCHAAGLSVELHPGTGGFGKFMYLFARTNPRGDRRSEILVSAMVVGGKTIDPWPAKEMLVKIEEAMKHPDAIAQREVEANFKRRTAERWANRNAAA